MAETSQDVDVFKMPETAYSQLKYLFKILKKIVASFGQREMATFRELVKTG